MLIPFCKVRRKSDYACRNCKGSRVYESWTHAKNKTGNEPASVRSCPVAAAPRHRTPTRDGRHSQRNRHKPLLEMMNGITVTKLFFFWKRTGIFVSFIAHQQAVHQTQHHQKQQKRRISGFEFLVPVDLWILNPSFAVIDGILTVQMNAPNLDKKKSIG